MIKLIVAHDENRVIGNEGKIPWSVPEDLKNFIIKRTNEKLHELNYDYGFDYDADSARNLDWFYHLTGGHTHTDFFAIRPTDYSKAGEGQDFDDIW